jgi:hypothetical protein
MYFVPEGQHDRSLARSAWDNAHRENSNHRIGAHACTNQTVPPGQKPFAVEGGLALSCAYWVETQA